MYKRMNNLNLQRTIPYQQIVLQSRWMHAWSAALLACCRFFCAYIDQRIWLLISDGSDPCCVQATCCMSRSQTGINICYLIELSRSIDHDSRAPALALAWRTHDPSIDYALAFAQFSQSQWHASTLSASGCEWDLLVLVARIVKQRVRHHITSPHLTF